MKDITLFINESNYDEKREERDNMLKSIIWVDGSGTNPPMSYDDNVYSTSYIRDDNSNPIKDVLTEANSKKYGKFIEQNKELLDSLVLYIGTNVYNKQVYALSKSSKSVHQYFPIILYIESADDLYKYIKKYKAFLTKLDVYAMNKKIDTKYPEKKDNDKFTLPVVAYTRK